MTNKIVIPEISDSELLALAKKIKPMVDVADLGLHYLNVKDAENSIHLLRNTSFIWNKRPGGKVRRPLKRRESITTYHKFGAPIFFKPSIAEVLAQLGHEQREWCQAFIIDEELTAANVHPAGFHFTTTHLYGF